MRFWRHVLRQPDLEARQLGRIVHPFRSTRCVPLMQDAALDVYIRDVKTTRQTKARLCGSDSVGNDQANEQALAHSSGIQPNKAEVANLFAIPFGPEA